MPIRIWEKQSHGPGLADVEEVDEAPGRAMRTRRSPSAQLFWSWFCDCGHTSQRMGPGCEGKVEEAWVIRIHVEDEGCPVHLESEDLELVMLAGGENVETVGAAGEDEAQGCQGRAFCFGTYRPGGES